MIKFWSFSVILTFLNICLSKIPPPEHGRFFYLDLLQDGASGLYHVELDVANETYKLFVTTGESSIGLISNECPDEMCHVTKKYNPEGSATYEERAGITKVDTVSFYDPTNYTLQDVAF